MLCFGRSRTAIESTYLKVSFAYLFIESPAYRAVMPHALDVLMHAFR